MNVSGILIIYDADVQVISSNSPWKFKPAFEERKQNRPQELAKVQMLVAGSLPNFFFDQQFSG